MTPLLHGGDIDAARRLFPGAPEPFIDLSTGVNPYSYPVPPLPSAAFAQLPQPAALGRLAAAAARFYGAPSPDHVVAAPGTQILLTLVAGLTPTGRAAVLGPTYAEHRRAAALAGHGVAEVQAVDELADADLAILTNPNNPDGRFIGRDRLLALAQARRGGLLVIDEAFMDVGPAGGSLAADTGRGGILVLRSFGKFFGLAGVRLGFAIAEPGHVRKLAAMLGPWAVSGPALAIGTAALADTGWAGEARRRLECDAARLARMLAQAGLTGAGGTALFRLVQTPAAGELYHRLGHAGIAVRRFDAQPSWLRIGLPGNEPAWERLAAALASFAR